MPMQNAIALMFSTKRRIGRARYCIGMMLATTVFVALYFWVKALDEAAQIGNPYTNRVISTEAILISLLMFPWMWSWNALGVKRCHDRGRSGWFQCVALIPIVGSLWLFIELFCLPGADVSNEWGPPVT